MKKIVAIINQKGGVGKSTTAEALLAGLSLKGYKTLAIDLDAQGNLTYSTGATTEGATALGILTGEVKAKEAIQQTKSGDIIASNKALAGADAFISDTGKEYRLKEALETISGDYDYIIIDTPPALGILTINALTACDSVIIPAQADIYSIQGIEQLAEKLGTKLFKTTIREAIAVKEAQISQESLYSYAPRAKVAEDYTNFIEELLKEKE